MFRVGKWAFPCCRTKLASGSRSLEVLLCMLYVVWRSHHTSWGTFWKNLTNMRMSQHIWVHPNLRFYANGTEAGGQRVLCFWLMGSAPSGIQTTHRSSIAPKTGGFTLVGGVELGHYDLMGCIPTFQSFFNFPGHLVRLFLLFQSKYRHKRLQGTTF